MGPGAAVGSAGCARWVVVLSGGGLLLGFRAAWARQKHVRRHLLPSQLGARHTAACGRCWSPALSVPVYRPPVLGPRSSLSPCHGSAAAHQPLVVLPGSSGRVCVACSLLVIWPPCLLSLCGSLTYFDPFLSVCFSVLCCSFSLSDPSFSVLCGFWCLCCPGAVSRRFAVPCV